MILKRLLFLFITSFLLGNAASAGGDTCESIVRKDLSAEDTQFQEKLDAIEQRMFALIEAYDNKLFPLSDPFMMVFVPEEGDALFQRLQSRMQDGQRVATPLFHINKAIIEFHNGGGFRDEMVEWMLEDSEFLLNADESAFSLNAYRSNLLALRLLTDYIGRFRIPDTIVDGNGDPQTDNQEESEEGSDDDSSQDDDQEGDESQEGDPQESDSQDGDSQDGEQQESDQQDEEEPEYPELPKEYQPQTNDLDQQSGDGKQPKLRVAEVNFRTPLFVQRNYAEIVRGAAHPFKLGTIPQINPAPGKYRKTAKSMRVKTGKKLEVTLFLPPGYRPLQPSDPRAHIMRSEEGEYILQLKEKRPFVDTPLVEEKDIRMLSHIQDIYKRPVGFKLEEWPDTVKANIFSRFSPDKKQDTLKISQAIADHIATDYLYSVGKQKELDPIEALKNGAFQCDMAAYAMVGLLRDVYQIPSRVAGGYRGKEVPDKPGSSQLILPNTPHVMVEVFHNGEWHLFDPTPVKKDRKEDKDENGESAPADIPLENTPDPEQEEGSEGESSDSESDSDSSSASEDESGDKKSKAKQNVKKRKGKAQSELDELEKEVHEDTAESLKGLEEEVEADSGSEDDAEPGDDRDSSEPSDTESSTDDDSSEGSSSGNTSNSKDKSKSSDSKDNDPDSLSEDEVKEQADLSEELELGSLNLDPEIENNPLVERTARLMLKMALEPTLSGKDSMELLERLSLLKRKFPGSEVKNLIEEGKSIHEKRHPALKDWIVSLANSLSSSDVNKSYQELFRIRKSLDLYTRLLDRNGKLKIPYELMAALNRAQQELDKLSHPDASSISIVDQFHRNLPQIVKTLMSQQHGLSTVGPNEPTRAVADLMTSGALADLVLLSDLNGISDFILNSTPRPEFVEVKTWMPDPSKRRGSDLLPTRSYGDAWRAIPGQPHLTIEENIAQGTAFIQTHRKRVLIPAGHGKEEAERITIVLYDTSGSMSGDRATFQAGLISAFTAKALSDISLSGKHRHKVLIVPFDGAPGTPVPVTNSQEALEILRNYQSQMANTGGSTHIQSALMQAMALIADAEKKSGEPLAAANIVLMTDGDDGAVNIPELQTARKLIDRDTPLQTMFIAIGGTNQGLMEFATESGQAGFDGGFYREFSDRVLGEYVERAGRTDFTEEENSFYTETKAKQVPRSVHRELSRAISHANKFVSEIAAASRHKSPADHLRELEKIKWRSTGELDRPLARWIQKLRGFAMHQVFNDKKKLAIVVDDLLREFESLTGVPLKELGDFEQEQLRHFIRYAAGQETGL